MSSFYELSKEERQNLVGTITTDIIAEIKKEKFKKTIQFFEDADTYIRKSAYLVTGRIYFAYKTLQQKIISMLQLFLQHTDFKIRQTVINSAGEIGKKDFKTVQHFFDTGLLTNIIQ